MVDGWVLWLLLAGLGIGAVSVWLLTVRLNRDEADISAAERHQEAAWIAATIERYGGVAPPTFVEEVLELHQAYLRTSGAGVQAGPVVPPPGTPVEPTNGPGMPPPPGPVAPGQQPPRPTPR